MEDKALEFFYNEMNSEIKKIKARMEARLHNKDLFAESLNKSDLGRIKSLISTQFCRENESLNLNMALSLNFSKWLDTEDPDYLDQVVLLCAKDKIPIRGVLLESLSIASGRRINREYNYGKKTKVNAGADKAIAHQKTFLLTEFCHKSLFEASFLVIGWLTMNYSNPSIKKASTLEKLHPSWVDNNKTLIQDITNHYPNGWTEEEERRYVNQFPINIPEKLRGNRRE